MEDNPKLVDKIVNSFTYEIIKPQLNSIVIKWYLKNGRNFPWRNTYDPYCILVAEFLLKRTKANSVIQPYYEIINTYPNLSSLSRAKISQLRNIFKPLGLFNRAELMISAAKTIEKKYKGIIPSCLKDLMDIPGIGHYSGRAIACLAYNKKVPMIDESSGRLIRKILKINSIRPAYSDKKLHDIVETILPNNNIRSFNLGLLDIAYNYCHSYVQNCIICPLKEVCFSYSNT